MDIIAEQSRSRGFSPGAFIIDRIDRASGRKTKEIISYNDEAWKIIFYADSHSKKNQYHAPDLSSLCSRWRVLLEKSIDEAKQDGNDESESHYFDLFKSGRRLYRVRGLLLSSKQTDRQQREKHFMYIIERVHPDSINYPMIFRNWQLNKREQDMVRIILKDRSNKEIAHLLGLSLN
ncbi:MAG: hypothetical protein L6290_10115 [Thermodesulfovibrionales bacterium]|nr:hypothetical protein [Thermodesulfovibrionales bacterium]